MLYYARYAPYGTYMAEVDVYDDEGGLIARDRQVRTWRFGRLTVVWQRDRWRRARWTRWMLPPMRHPYKSYYAEHRPPQGWMARLLDW